MSIALPAIFLLVQLLVLTLAPPGVSQSGAYLVMVLAPLGAALAALWRAGHEGGSARRGWLSVALSLALWTVGAAINLWHDLILKQSGQMYSDAMLAFNLATVPLAFMLASEWRLVGPALVRWTDAVMALVLGLAYFLVNWLSLNARGAPDEAGLATMVWLYDAQNLYLALGALARWRAATSSDERSLFGAFAAYAALYTGLAALNNHIFAVDASLGPEYATVITLAFALLAWMTVSRCPANLGAPARPAFIHAVHSASPILLAGALLMVSLVLIRLDYVHGALGVLIAVVGHGLRSTLAQVGHIERGNSLQREHTELQTIARTDAVTGIPNRHCLHPTLDTMWRMHRRSGAPLSVLMIDIDHFKQFNDRHGHPAGDACLRDVAMALQSALVRPGDMLVRYGGEEFIALLQDADAAACSVVAERLRLAVQALAIPHVDNRHGVVTVSLGAASALPQTLPSTLPGLGGMALAGAAALVQAADRALYQAKQAGRNCVAA